MSTTSKNKMLLVAVVILLLTNIGMILFFLNHRGGEKGRSHGSREEVMTGFLQKDIGFSKSQMEQYDTLSKAHRDKVKAIFDEVRSNKEQQFKLLAAQNFDDSAIHTIAAQSAEKQKVIEEQMFTHLKEVRKICTPDQLPKFDSLFYKVWDRRGESRKKPGK